MSELNILLIGDIAGKPGMNAVRKLLPKFVADNELDFVIANGENAARGVGITPDLADELIDLGVDCITTGNHIWRHREIRSYIGREPRLIRPLNFSGKQPGAGFGIFETAAGIEVGVVNLAGRVYMDPSDNPFDAAEEALDALREVRLRIFDIHAEATSEKRAMGFYLAGRAAAVIGTHTHVQTADEQILEGGTAYLTDVGMTGPHDSIIGMRKDLITERFVTGLPSPFKLAKQGARFQAVIVRASNDTGKASAIERVDIPLP
jgi:metallophosphoesterase (TIGR00282 family)